jgi:hypothetical protein
LNASNGTIEIFVDKNIVEIIIGKLLIDPDTDKDELNNPETALKIFFHCRRSTMTMKSSTMRDLWYQSIMSSNFVY